MLSLKTLEGKAGAVTITVKDHGLTSIAEEMARLQSLTVSYGYQGRNGLRKYENGVNVATVAMIQEFGTDDIPARPFMRRAFKDGEDRIKSAWAKALTDVAQGNATAVDALSGVGEVGVILIRESIDRASTWAPPLSSSTVDAKGSSDPLVDTGLLRDSVSYVIREGNNGPIIKEGTV